MIPPFYVITSAASASTRYSRRITLSPCNYSMAPVDFLTCACLFSWLYWRKCNMYCVSRMSIVLVACSYVDFNGYPNSTLSLHKGWGTFCRRWRWGYPCDCWFVNSELLYKRKYLFLWNFGKWVRRSKRRRISNNLQSPILAASYCDLGSELETADFVLVLLQPDFLLRLQLRQLQNENLTKSI